MIWYLLYPLRRTTEAPVLAPNHPFRKTFSRYGRLASTYVKIGLPLSVLFAFLLIYPIFFLYTSDSKTITNGASNLPHHVWTDAQRLDGPAVPEPDVIMRSIWVHGSYMKALEPDVLLGALELQDELLGPTENFDPRQAAPRPNLADLGSDLEPRERNSFHIINGVTNQSWFFHSPLQYWSGSAENIAADHRILATVNERKNQSTSVNITLRHSIVFSGKRFEDRQLVAADALVITLIHLHDSPVGRQWVRKAEALTSKGSDKWTIIPPDGRSTSSQLYEFQFRPISWLDWVLLTVAYVFTVLYVTVNLSRIRAIKSKAGLMIAILLQIASSIASSFTVCAIFKVDVSKVPYYAYPLVILAISMENSLRLINAVIMNSSTVNINHRIGDAFGETAHIAIGNRAGNLTLLLILSTITYPGVAAFCTFAAIAIVFDFFYMSTFFLSVLKLDVRQRELSDIEKASQKRSSPGPDKGQDNHLYDRVWHWMRHETLTPTRIVGTMVLVAFVLIANSHAGPAIGFQLDWLVFRGFWTKEILHNSGSSLLENIHQARSPPSWLRLQDHETAREVINAIKPSQSAHRYIARVYDPVVFVQKGADRTPTGQEGFFLPAVYDFLHHEIPAYIALSVVLFLFLSQIATYLAMDQVVPVTDPDHPEDEPLLSVKSLSGGHRLDVFMMASSKDGVLASAGLDRIIRVWDVRSGRKTRVLTEPGYAERDPFPLLAMAVDSKSKWLALLSSQRVSLWNIREGRWGPAVEVETGGIKPVAFFFGHTSQESIRSLLIVKRDGRMIEVHPGIGEAEEYLVCKTPLVWAVSFAEKLLPGQSASRLSILTASRKSCIHLVTQHDRHWLSEEVKLPAREQKEIHSVVPIPAFSLYLIARRHSVDMVDLYTSNIIHTFSTEPMEPRTLRQIFSSWNPSTGMTSFTLAYTNADTKELVLQTYLPSGGHQTICPCNPSDLSRKQSCCPWDETTEIIRHVQNPGSWETLRSGCVVGVRKKLTNQGKPPSAPSFTSGLRLRHAQPETSSPSLPQDEWEVWVMNQFDEEPANCETRPLVSEADADVGGHLLISALGPVVKVGGGSVAVAFGKAVKVVAVGHEHFDSTPDDNPRAPDRRKRGQSALAKSAAAPRMWIERLG